MSLSVTAVEFDATFFVVRLSDGGKLRIPFAWFPVLNSASPDQRDKVRISPSGNGLHWDELDEDTSVEALLFCCGNEIERGPFAP